MKVFILHERCRHSPLASYLRVFASICGFQFLPKLRQFVWSEVGEDLAVHVHHRREALAGEIDHFRHGLAVRNHVERFVLDAALVEPVLRLVAPRAIRFDEETDFHKLMYVFLIPRSSRLQRKLSNTL